MRAAISLLLLVALAGGAPAQDDRTKELCVAFQKSLDDGDDPARDRVIKLLLAIGRAAIPDIRAAREAWASTRGRELAKIEALIKALNGQVDALGSKPKLSPLEEPIYWKAVKDLEEANKRVEPLRGQRLAWENLENEVAKCPAARIIFMPDDKNPTPNRIVMLSYLGAMLNGDEIARRGWFENLIRIGADGVAESKVARAGWRKMYDDKLQERIDAMRALQVELNRERDGSRQRDQAILEKLTSARAATDLLQGQIARLEWLENELELRFAWKENRPLLDTMQNLARSFDNFGRLGKWPEAMKCVSPSTEDQARRLFKPLRMASVLAAGAERWHLAGIYLPQKPDAANLLLLGEKIGDCSVMPDARLAFEGASAVIQFTETELDGQRRIVRVTTGELFDPKGDRDRKDKKE